MKRKSLYFHIAFIVLGGLSGYLYWYYIGCRSGSCPITSKWLNTTLYGGVLGYLVGSSLFDVIKKKLKGEKSEKQ